MESEQGVAAVSSAVTVIACSIIAAAVIIFMRSTNELIDTEVLREHLADVCRTCVDAARDGDAVAAVERVSCTHRSTYIMLVDAERVRVPPKHADHPFPHGFAAQNDMLRARVLSQNRSNGHVNLSMVDPHDMRARTSVVAYEACIVGERRFWVLAWKGRGAEQKNNPAW
tara:strand:+ start:78 stop:587 length:510 start_codon:yes stop_codon:yes gene_type:complete